MDSLTMAADHVARDFLTGKRAPDEFHVAVTRNAILDCLYSAEEPDFIARICGPIAHPSVRETAQRVIRRIIPHIDQLVGRTLWEMRA